MNIYTNKFELNKKSEIKEFFVKLDAEFDVPQYTQFRAKVKGANATFYSSGKFVIQGANIDKLVEEFECSLGLCKQTKIAISTQQNNASENTTFSNYEKYIGTDESGKGDYFGPLVIAGVMISDKNKQMFLDLGIKDSKKLQDTTIKKLAASIKNNSIFSIVVITPEKYNELYYKFKNLNKLLAWGHARVIENILAKEQCEYALSDQFGDESLILNALMKNGRKIKLDQRHRAESDVAVAAASIIARAEFVKRMEELEKKYNQKLSKGASEQVVRQAQEFVQKYSKDELKMIAKLHFKTTNQII